MDTDFGSLSPYDGSWGLELFDQSEKVQKIITDNNNLIDEYLKLFKEQFKHQLEFGKKLNLKSASFDMKNQANPLSTHSAYDCFVKYFAEMGISLQQNAKEGVDQVVTSFKTLGDTEKKNMEIWKNKFSQFYSNADQQQRKLEASWQKYVNSFKDKAKAYEAKLKADQDKTLSRLEQSKFSDVHDVKKKIFDAARFSYAEALDKYTEYQLHSNKCLVNYIEEIDSVYRKNINGMRNALLKNVGLTQTLLDRLFEQNQMLKNAVESIDASKDAICVANSLKTDCHPPPRLPFLDLEICPPTVLEGPSHDLAAYMLGLTSAKNTPQLANFVGKRASTKSSKDDFQNLRSAFICDLGSKPISTDSMTVFQATERLEQLKEMYSASENEITGLNRLRDTYAKDSKLGDASNLEPQIMLVRRRLQSLHNMIAALEKHYNDLGGSNATRISNAPGANPSHHVDSDFDTDDEAPPAKNSYLGQATVKYSYEGNGSDYLATNVGDIFYVTAFDNQGWTRVVSKDGSRQGFVPTAYIDITRY